MIRNPNIPWFTWERQRRSLELAKVFDAELVLFDLRDRNRTLKYFIGCAATITYLLSKRPRLVYAQNPSLILAFLLSLLKRLFGYKLVIDRHSNFKTLRNKGMKNYLFLRISEFTLRKADLTIVTNDFLANLVEEKGGHGIVLEDKLPEMISNATQKLDGSYNIAFVTSFSKDEPIKEVVNAFKDLNNDIVLYITGNYKNYNAEVIASIREQRNIHLTGYLSDSDYIALLHSVDAIMVLTKAEYTMTCGAYEGVSIGKPMILSNTSVIRNYFTKGVIFCDPDKQSIMNSVQELMINHDKLLQEILELRPEITAKWNNRIMCVKNEIKRISETTA